jgi:isopenicillin N synthase-like dioxygenase
VKNHGVPMKMMNNAVFMAREFFKLPENERMKPKNIKYMLLIEKKVTTPSTQTHSICTSFLSCMKTLTFKNLYENMGYV